MKAIYVYTMKKYLKSYSTWVILLLSALGIGFMIGGYLPFAFVNVNKINAPMVYVKSIMAAIAGVSVFFGIFSAIFAGFKSASMYKDEVENGTFLVLLSKPLRRGQIVFGKWLALQTLLVGYGLISVIFLCIGIEIFDNGDQISGLKSIGVSTLKSHIWFVGLFIFLILYITSLFFSSVGLILSIRLSTGATIGITIALGIYIPLSGLLSIFMRKPEAIPISKTDAYTQMFAEHFEKSIDSNPAMQLLFPDMKKDVADLVATTKSSDLYDKAIATGDKDSFKNAWWLDVDYQFRLLSGFAYEKVIPEKILSSVNDNSLGGMLELPKSVQTKGSVKSKSVFDGIKTFLEKYQSIGTEAAKALTLQNILELQPVTSKDFTDFVANRKSSTPIFVPSANIQSIVSNFTSNAAGPMTFEKIQQWLFDNQNLFVDAKATLEEFMQFVLTDENRDSTNFIINDDYKIKIPKQNLVNLHVKTKQNYDFLRAHNKVIGGGMDDYEKEYIADTADYPQQFYTNLEALGDSKPLVEFLQHAEKMYHDPTYNAYLDPNNTQLDTTTRYIDFKFYKEWLAIEFLNDSPAGSTRKFYTTNLSSSFISEARTTSNGSVIFDENFMRTSLYTQQHFWDFLYDTFKDVSRGKIDPANNKATNPLTMANALRGEMLTKTYISNINELLEPVSNMLFHGGGDGSLHLGDTEIQLHDIADIRKSIEGDNYDLSSRFNKNYASDVDDPITNLSVKDKRLFRTIMSAATNDQLVNAKVKPYANKTTLLIVYATLALALVPAAHWLVRRQDFR